MEPHEEDTRNALIYRRPFAYPIRAIFAIQYPLLLLLPLLLTLKKYRFKWKLYLGILGLNVLLLVIWSALGGERAREMHFWACIHALFSMLIVLFLTLVEMGIGKFLTWRRRIAED